MIKRGNIKRLHPCFVICHLDINTVLILASIDPVDLPASKLQFISARQEIALFHLLRQCPDRTPDQLFDPRDHVFISGAAVKHGISIIKDTFLYARIDQFASHSFIHLRPFCPMLIRFSCKTFHRLVRDIPQIHRLKLILLPLGKPQSIRQEMSIRASGKSFQPCHTYPFRISEQRPGSLLPQPIRLFPVKCRVKQKPRFSWLRLLRCFCDRIFPRFCCRLCCLFCFPFCDGFLCRFHGQIPTVKLLPGIGNPLLPVPESRRQILCHTASGQLLLRQRPRILILHGDPRKHPPQILHKISRAERLSVSRRFRPGKDQSVGRFRQIHIQVKFLDIRFFFRSRRQRDLLLRKMRPVTLR